jgi:hypothetical protein
MRLAEPFLTSARCGTICGIGEGKGFRFSQQDLLRLRLAQFYAQPILPNLNSKILEGKHPPFG